MSLAKKALLKKRVEVVVYRDPIDPKWFVGEAIVEGELVADQGEEY